MSECTGAERDLIEAAVAALCEMDRAQAHDHGLRGQVAQGLGAYPVLPSPLREACVKVAIERITPERKEALRRAFIAERELTRKKAQLEAGIPGSVWVELVKEIYPKDEE